MTMLRCLWITVATVSAACAQMQDNRDPKLTCEQGRFGNRQHHCDLREQPLAGVGRLDVDAGPNGGASVRGWLRNDVLVRSRVDAWAESDSEASLLASQVHVDASAGRLRSSGPESTGKSGWSVSYEIFVPQNTDLTLKTNNGGVSISDIRGTMEFTTQNGGLHLARIAGDVSGSTTNGGVHIELGGASWEGRQLDVRTVNGGVNLSMPQAYSAHIQTETTNGSVNSDFPVSIQGARRLSNLDFNVGSGGALIHVSTTNGGIKLHRL